MSEASQWKALVRARLAAARSSFLSQLLGLPTVVLEEEVIDDGLTSVRVLLLIGREDEVRAASIERVLDGADGEVDGLAPRLEANTPFSVALERFVSARATLLSALARVPDETLFRPLAEGGTTVANWAEECLEHDEISVDRLAEWRGCREKPDELGPGDLLTAAMRAARKEMLTAIALIPKHERPGWALGSRSLEDALRELSRWEQALLTHLAGGEEVHVSDDQPAAADWGESWRTLHDTHHALVRLTERKPEQELARRVSGTWSGERRVYDLLRVALMQDRQVAAGIRTSLEVSPAGSRDSP